MKTILTLLFATVLSATVFAQATGLSLETVAIHDGMVGDHDLTGYTTYRLYVNFTNPEDFLTSFYGNPTETEIDGGDPIPPTPFQLYAAEGNFFQHPLGSPLASDINPLLFTSFPALSYDSWFTIGSENTDGGQCFFISTEDDPLGPFEENGENINMEEGIFYLPNGPDNFQAVAGDDLKVLVGQFTTNGTLGGQFMVLTIIEGIPGNTHHAVFNFPDDDSNVLGCTDAEACNFDPLANISDASCEFQGCLGCTDPLASNYDPEATIDDGSCFDCSTCVDHCLALSVSEGENPSAVAWTLRDEEGVLILSGGAPSANTVLCLTDGCYTFEMTDGSNSGWSGANYTFLDSEGNVFQTGSLSTAGAGNQASLGQDVFSLGSVSDCVVSGCTNPDALNYDPDATVDDGSCSNPGCNDPDACFYNENDTGTGDCCYSDCIRIQPYEVLDVTLPFTLMNGETTFSGVINESSNYTAGICAGDGCYELVIPENWGTDSFGFQVSFNGITVYTGSYEDASFFEGSNSHHLINIGGADCDFGCTDSNACNFSALATEDDGSCDYSCYGCTDPSASNYSPIYTIEDGSCVYQGCMDDTACNYDPNATLPGDCDFACAGCMDITASNYDPIAISDDGSCCYSNSFLLNFDWYNEDEAENQQWNIIDSEGEQVLSGTVGEPVELCLEDGCYRFEMLDALGFGWGEQMYFLDDLNGNTLYENFLWSAQEGDGSFIGIDFWSIGLANCIGGCTIPEACNYIPEADFNDGSCILPSCLDPVACNFNSNPDACPGGECIYEAQVSGILFNDLNQDGQLQTELGEYGVGFMEITLSELEMTVFTDENGNYSFNGIPTGTYTIELPSLGSEWLSTGPDPLVLVIEDCTVADINFGIVAVDSPPVFATNITGVFGDAINCETGLVNGLWLTNTGSSAVTVLFTLAFDPLLDYSTNPVFGIGPDDVLDDVAIWNSGNVNAGENIILDMTTFSPGLDYIGEFFSYTYSVSVYDANNELLETIEWTEEAEVTCAYDPNDKQTAFEGYTEEHFILPDETMEYRIRFQNTGNATATNVNIVDSLDVDHLDLSTFTPIISSHNMMTCINSDGHVDFVFDNIMLPDSAADLAGSQGYLVYQIRPRADVDPGDVINNTAHIFFDSNPAIVTNTTWHTIYECPAEPAVAQSDIEVCEAQDFTLSSEEPYMESYFWVYNGQEIGFEESLVYSFEESGLYEIELTTTNPLCSTMRTLTVDVSTEPDASYIITENGLFATLAPSYQWLLNGEAIEGATDQVYVPLVDGEYAVVVTNELGCESTSESQFIVSVEEALRENFSVFPNPAQDYITVEFGTFENAPYTIYDVLGKQVGNGTWQDGNPISIQVLARGSYTLVFGGKAVRFEKL